MLSKRTIRNAIAAFAAILLILGIGVTIALDGSGGSGLADLSGSTLSQSGSSLIDSFAGLFEASRKKKSKPAEPMMGVMKNETAKAELGRSAWRLLHTMAGKFPAKPTKAQQASLNDYIYLFAELYPCGDCARHFKLVLDANPPDVSGKAAVADWACRVHNIVNKRLKKPIFDCSRIMEFYDCGCGPEEDA